MTTEIQNIDSQCYHAVDVIKDAIMKSQLRAVKLVNQEQLALYYGIGRYVSENTRNKNWGSGAIKTISNYLRKELPGLRGFSETNLKNMRMFYEAWSNLESNLSVQTDELQKVPETEDDKIRQLQLTKSENFPRLTSIDMAQMLNEELFFMSKFGSLIKS